MKFSEFIPLDKRHITAQQLALVHATFETEKPPKKWIEVAQLWFMVLRAAPAFSSIADQDLANACVTQVYLTAHFMGGGNVYLSKGDRMTLTEKNKLVISEFRGKNYDELADKHGLTTARIRQIIEQERQVARNKTGNQEKAKSC